jgi:3-deoxy-manno-octulosonate cytidylyltransferase (CMP-KDO synthetase)
MVTVVIPSRFHSTRFPGKALAPVAGVPLVVRVAEGVRESGVADRVLVATDDERIAAAVGRVGIEVWLSTEPFRSGSDRVAAAIAALDPDGSGPVLNVQGDEALLDRRALAGALAALEGNDLGTVATPLDATAAGDRDAVKVEIAEGRALRFDRGAIESRAPLHLHLGIYGFTRDALVRFAVLPTSPGERRSDLEQLRALEHGMRIGVRLLDGPRYLAVNRPADLARAEQLLGRDRTTS